MTDTYEHRKRLYALLQIGRARLGMDEDEYRSFLAARGATEKQGRISATTLSIVQLHACIDDMIAAGFKPIRASPSRRNWRSARVDKIRALWRLLFESGVVYDGSEPAMTHWCATVTKKPRLDLTTSRELNACIEGLKSWARRKRVPIKR